MFNNIPALRDRVASGGMIFLQALWCLCENYIMPEIAARSSRSRLPPRK